jgi:hypothetical protein
VTTPVNNKVAAVILKKRDLLTAIVQLSRKPTALESTIFHEKYVFLRRILQPLHAVMALFTTSSRLAVLIATRTTFYVFQIFTKRKWMPFFAFFVHSNTQ